MGISYEVSNFLHLYSVAYGALAILDTIPMPVYSLDCTLHLPPTPG